MEFPPRWFPHTKLQAPQRRDDLISRPRVLTLLNQALTTSALTLIAAPAGYGKTTLVVDWMQTTEAQDVAVAWLSLDAEDDDPVVFFTGLLAALQRHNPACGVSLQSTMMSGQTTPHLTLTRLLGVLINDILALFSDHVILVLDDLDILTNRAIYTALDYLIEHLPHQMRLVVTTRTEPPLALARLRTHHHLSEIRMPELRFTLAETADFLNEHLHLAVSPDALDQVSAHTEGWVTSLRLLAASLITAPVPERARLLTHLLRDNHVVFDVLATEVLNRQPPLIRQFLLETALLEELTADLCTAVTGRADTHLLLRELYQRNLFLVTIDDAVSRTPAYRYHALFAAFLHHQLALERPQDVALLHVKAAAASVSPARAIPHYLAAAAWQEAATCIYHIAEDLVSHGLFERLRTWIMALPEDERSAHPWLLYFLGVCAWGQSHFMPARHYLETALARFTVLADEAGCGETSVLLATLAQTGGDFTAATRYLHDALACPLSPRSQMQLLMGQAWIALGAGENAQMTSALTAALDLAEQGDAASAIIVVMQVREVFGVVAAGRAALERVCRLIASRVALTQVSPLAANYYVLQAALRFWQGSFAAAIEAAEQALVMAEQLGGLPWMDSTVTYYLPMLYTLAQRRREADQAMTRLQTSLDGLPGWYTARAASMAYVYLDRNDLARGQHTFLSMMTAQREHEWPASPCARSLVQGLLALAERRFPEAEQSLLAAQAQQQRTSLCASLGDVALALTGLYLRWQRPGLARRMLEPAMRHWCESGLPGWNLLYGATLLTPVLTFAIQEHLDGDWAAHVLTLLQGVSRPSSLRIPETGREITPRELEVLRLMTTGASNHAIAAALVVSLPTIKTHVSRILTKLAVPSRAAAAARARELHLV